MVLTNVFNPKATRRKHRPVLNQIPVTNSNNALRATSNLYYDKKKFWTWFKTRPELCSPVMTRVDDTISKIEFTDLQGGPLDKEGFSKAQKVWDQNQMYERLKSMQFDRLVTGSGFLWKGNPLNQRSSQKELYMKNLRELCIRQAKKEIGDISTRSGRDACEKLSVKLFLRAIDEDVRTERIIDYMASSTVVIEFDLYDVKAYKQYYPSNVETFSTEEIVHIPLHRLDGKVDGFTPVSSLAYELILLWAIKENMLAYFRNGGTPSKIFVLKDSIANDQNHEWLTQELMDQGIVENRNGNLVMTGDVEIHDLGEKIKDMDYEQLAKYVTNNIGYALRVPQTRMPYNLDGGAVSDAGGLGESGYWVMIESDQLTIEQHLNHQIFEELGFRVKFKRMNTSDKVKESQAANQNIAFITQTNMGLRNMYGKRIRLDKYVNMATGSTRVFSVKDVEDVPKEQLMAPMEKNSMLNQSFLKDKEVLPGKASQNKGEVKKNAATNNPSNQSQGGF